MYLNRFCKGVSKILALLLFFCVQVSKVYYSYGNDSTDLGYFQDLAQNLFYYIPYPPKILYNLIANGVVV